MSNLIARILLAILMFPLACVAYLAMVPMMDYRFRNTWGLPRSVPWLVAGAVTWLLMAVYWWLLWGRSVRWTGERWAMTVGAALLAVVVGVIIGSATSGVNEEFGAFMGSATAPLLWVTATVFIWRENRSERGQRVDPKGQGVVCLSCGYNMTGLSELRCPECGRKFTVDELFAGQPSRAGAELEAKP